MPMIMADFTRHERLGLWGAGAGDDMGLDRYQA